MTDAILDKVRKLLAKAEDPGCTPAEAEALTDKAAQLIAKYGVDRALLAAAAPEIDPLGDRVIGVGPPYALDKAGLLATVAGAMRCRSVRRKERTQHGYAYAMHLFGFATDLERVELLYTSLLVQASIAMAAVEVPEWDSPAAFRRSWLVGFAWAVGERLRRAEERASAVPQPAGGPPVALVLADRRDRVDRRVEAAYPRLRVSPTRRLMGGGLDSGYAAGQRADLGDARVAGQGKRRHLAG
ncbi:MAG: DUF2786 domain-containing protein [Betaproteobacteria bacterium]